jgi:Bacteriophage lambda head decoration protein D
MTVLTQPPTQGDVLKFELNPNYTRETVTLLAGTDYPVGAVLGRITTGGKYKLSPAAGSDGAQTAAAVLLYAVDAAAADAPGVVLMRGPAIVSKAALVVDPSVDDAAKVAAKHSQLVALGIVPRTTA